MKILFINRQGHYSDPGGDTVQVENTARELRKLNIEVDIISAGQRVDYTSYELLHLFNIIRPADFLLHIRNSGKPYVISTIYVDYSEFDRLARGGIFQKIANYFSPDFLEYAKAFFKWITGKERIIAKEYLWLGHRLSVKKLLQSAAMLLPNSENEYRRLVKSYQTDADYRAIPNGIDPAIFVSDALADREPKLLLCVGRIEGRKNQLSLIHSILNSDYSLIIIGAAAKNQPEYYAACRRHASDRIIFIDNISQNSLLEYYARAKVHILPSWFETTGLVSLEAAVMGCNLVITDKGDTREYFGDHAWYCDPSSTASIRSAIDEAALAPSDPELKQKILSDFTWKQSAMKTLNCYKDLLKAFSA